MEKGHGLQSWSDVGTDSPLLPADAGDSLVTALPPSRTTALMYCEWR